MTLTGNNVTIHNEYKSEADVTLPWEKIYGAVRVKEAVYLYAVRTRAFILPDGQSDGDAWALLKSVLPQNKLIDRRK